ncbi:MAG: ABC transporter ATP-binding protein [Eubacteriales bacterium]|nr:ABC transporter ATP-binding protein [Eubacteriales bacterium]
MVDLREVNKRYGENHVVRDLSLQVYEGEFLTMLGSSGCGKTTTLRMIAGFEEATSGSIRVNGVSVENQEPFERNVNTVFQSYALFPHMTVADNVAYGLRIKKTPKAEIRERVAEMLELVQLGGFERRRPSQLSGGQKQRVAIARALINRPQVLLLDEPLGALDLKLRKQMQIELKRLQRKLNITFIYVTHDQEEALTMSDRIAIMNNGILEQIGTPKEIYEQPASKFVATFIGETNLFEGCVSRVSGSEVGVTLETGEATAFGERFTPGEMVAVSVRPERIRYSREPVEGFSIEAMIREQIYVGSVLKTIAELPNGNEIRIERLAGEKIPEGGRVYLYWEQDDAKLIHSRSHAIYDAVENMSFV